MSKGIHVLKIKSIRHIRDGKVIWEANDILNMLHDEGEQAILSAYFATAMSGFGAAPANLFFGLDARASLVEADTLSSLTSEPTTSGYSRQTVSTGGSGGSGQPFYINQPAAYYRADSSTVTFTATGSWPTVSKLFLGTVASGTAGKLISSIALTADRKLVSGDKLETNMQIGLSEA